ncbi:MAG: S-methyl-5-thioribose-1-phosphate isomerase [Gemmatimonadales bacterium]
MTLPPIISWSPSGAVRILDQTLLPGEVVHRELGTVPEVAEAIRQLRVRGAPLIGVAAAMGVCLAGEGAHVTRDDVDAACDVLRATRPTAVNLAWALERMRRVAGQAGADRAPRLRAEADAIRSEEFARCRAIGEAGLPLVPDGAVVMTWCNAGALATGELGTALAPVYLAHAAGRRVHVLVPETRPLLQGSRLTAWELSRAGVPCTVLADSAAAGRLARGDVTCAIVGADRIAANGDVANKVGTYGLALAARAHGVPFYVAAPSSTFDPATPSGAEIIIEQRADAEILELRGTRVGAEVPAWNPAFDVTPAELVAGYITEKGLDRTRRP